MKIDAVLALVKPHLAADANLDTLKATILAADKGAKDKAAKDKAAKDRQEAYDKARDSMSDEEKKAFDAMPDGEEKDKVAKDRRAKDENTDPEHTNDEDIDAEDNDLSEAESGTPSKTGASKKPAVDSADIDRRVATAVAAAVSKRDGLHLAQTEVEPILGKRTFDSAGAAYKAGLEALGVDLTDIPESAYRAVLKMAKDRAPAAPVVAMDAAGSAELAKLIPNLNRLP